MAHFLNNKCCKLVCISAIALTSLSSCMKDDITGCPTAKLSLKFDYTYNVKEADAFSAEVKNLNVYVFDKNGKFVDNYTESADKFETGHKMEITDLQEASIPSSAWLVTSSLLQWEQEPKVMMRPSLGLLN